jgi:hypothetical protein
MARSTALAVRGANGTVTTLPPLRTTVRVRWPLSMPRASMSAPIASETRRPFRARSEIRACSGCGAEAGGDQQRAYFIAVEPDGMALVVQAGTTYVDCGRGPDHALSFG